MQLSSAKEQIYSCMTLHENRRPRINNLTLKLKELEKQSKVKLNLAEGRKE
jgi:hypothetical protein